MKKLQTVVALSLITTILTASTWVLAQGGTPPVNTSDVISINFVRSGTDNAEIPNGSITGLAPADQWNNTDGALTGANIPLTLSSGSKEAINVSLTYSAPSTWSYVVNVIDAYLKNFLGDGSGDIGAQITVNNIPFPVYDVIIYQATDSAGKFNPPAVNGSYYTWDPINNMTILAEDQTRNANANQYGTTQKALATLGDNALRITGLVNPTLPIAGAGKVEGVARGSIAAIQIIKRSELDFKNVTLDTNTSWSEITTWTSHDQPTTWVNDGTSLARIQINGSITLTVDSVGTPASPVDAKSVTFLSDATASVTLAGAFSTEMLDLTGLKGAFTIPANTDIGELRYQSDLTQKVTIDVAGIDFPTPITTILRARNLQLTRLETAGVLPERAILSVAGDELQVVQPTDVTFDIPIDWNVANVPTMVMTDIPTGLVEYIDNVNAHQTVGERDVIAVHIIGGNTSGIYGLHRLNNRGYLTLDKDVYIKVSGGTHALVTAGQESGWRSLISQRVTTLTGNQFTEIAGGTVTHVIGAGDRAGSYTDADLTLKGHAAIVINGDTVVKGSIVGGWTSIHGSTAIVTGNTSVKITTVLGLATEPLLELPAGLIIGGGTRVTNNNFIGSRVGGNTTVTIDLPAEATGSFARKIIGGAYANNTSQHIVEGSSTVTITAPNTVTFSDEIYGGGYSNAGAVENNGLATVSLNGGTYTSNITAGSWHTNGTTGPATLSIMGGVFNGATLRPGIATGDKTLTFSGTPTFTGASNIEAGFTSVNVASESTLNLGGTTQVHSPITGNVTITDGSVTAPSTDVFLGATVAFESSTKLQITITNAQKDALTTSVNTDKIPLFKVATGANAKTIGMHVQLKPIEGEILPGLIFSIVNDILYVAKAVSIASGSGSATPEVVIFVNGLANGIDRGSITIEHANMLYLFNAKSWPVDMDAVKFSVTSCIILDVHQVSITVTIEGVDRGVDKPLNGTVHILGGASLDSLALLGDTPISSSDGKSFTFNVSATDYVFLKVKMMKTAL